MGSDGRVVAFYSVCRYITKCVWTFRSVHSLFRLGFNESASDCDSDYSKSNEKKTKEVVQVQFLFVIRLSNWILFISIQGMI